MSYSTGSLLSELCLGANISHSDDFFFKASKAGILSGREKAPTDGRHADRAMVKYTYFRRMHQINADT